MFTSGRASSAALPPKVPRARDAAKFAPGHNRGVRSPDDMGSSARLAWSLPLATALAVGCATPAGRLTTRVVDDRLVFPRRLLGLSLNTSGERLDTTRMTTWNSELSFRYGLTDKLELRNLTLGWAPIDDAPLPAGTPPEARRARLGLVFRGGINGIGSSSLEGLILFPMLSAEIVKHLGQRTSVSAQLVWSGVWVENPQATPSLYPYTPSLWPNSDSTSDLYLYLGAVVQLVDHVALWGGGSTQEARACFVPTCDLAARGGEVIVGPVLRPWSWLTLWVLAYAGERWRVANPVFARPVPLTPDAPPLHASRLGVSVTLMFTW